MSATRIDLPFPSLEKLRAALPLILSTEGIFIQTAHPPPLGTEIDMTLQVGAAREEVARFEARVVGHTAHNPMLAGRKGVQLEFTKVHPNAVALFSEFVHVREAAPDSPPKESPGEITFLADDEILKPEEKSARSAAPEPSAPEVQDLASAIQQFTTRPELTPEDVQILNSETIYQGVAAYADDLSRLQGRAGYEMSDLIFGIDLGTCYSCVSVFREGQLKVLADERGHATVPSVVSFTEDGKIIVGHEAQKLLATFPRTTVFGAKRLIGRNYHSAIVQKMIQYFPYKVVPDDKNHPAIDIFGKPVSLELVSAEILKYMVRVGQTATHEEIDKVIITVPAYYSDNQRAAVKNAGVLAGLNVVRIINEPTAAALAVGFDQRMQKRVLVYDLGGGTFDISILEIKDNTFKVIATGGDTFLGGEDFDNRMVKWVLDSSRDEKIFLARNAITFERVKQACEAAKRDLSDKKETSINLPYIQTADGKTINFQRRIQREQLVQLTRDLVEKSLRICDMVLNDGKMTIADIDEVVLVGGMTRVPFVKNSVHQHYKKKPFGEVNPDEAVAMGAALLGGELTGSKKVSLSDVLSMSIGIGLPKNRYKPILMKNTSVPCQKKYKIKADLSSEYTIDVFQGESEKCDTNEYLGTLVFSDEVKTPDDQSLEIEFELSAECLLSCTIRNPASGKTEKALLITHDTPPSAKLA